MAYQLLAGVHPYWSASDFKSTIRDKVVTHNPPSLHSLGKASQTFSDIVERISKKEPYQRYRTIDAFHAALIAAKKEIA